MKRQIEFTVQGGNVEEHFDDFISAHDGKLTMEK